jgi:NAD+ synthase (glutamine-hydrolysing)
VDVSRVTRHCSLLKLEEEASLFACPKYMEMAIANSQPLVPVRHRNVRYNTRVLCTYRHIYGIRAKQSLANSGLYREARHFSGWTKERTLETYYVEQCAKDVTGQSTCPIGDFILSTPDTAVTCETCEELFTPLNPSSHSGLK